jgi:predicted membrane channel-forming protein YqfA (hemolysin III family)
VANEEFDREMNETRQRIGFMSAPYTIACGGVCIGLSFASLLFTLLLNEERNWLQAGLFLILGLQGAWAIHTGFNSLNARGDSRG